MTGLSNGCTLHDRDAQSYTLGCWDETVCRSVLSTFIRVPTPVDSDWSYTIAKGSFRLHCQ